MADKQRLSSSKFATLELMSIPERERASVKDFIENINSYGMLSTRAGCRSPEGAKVFVSETLDEAYHKARRWSNLGDLLRMTICKEPVEPEFTIRKGFEAINIASILHKRISDVSLAMESAFNITEDELDRRFAEHLPRPITMPICISASFCAGLRAVADISFEGRELYLEHAAERWKLIEDGFCIYAFKGAVPFIYYASGESSGWGHDGPLKYT